MIYIILQHTPLSMSDHFLFGSVFIKKNNQTEIFFKKNQNWVKPTVSVRFFRAKPVWLGFLVRFFAYKTEPNRLVFSKF
jgi:hypothetical protein